MSTTAISRKSANLQILRVDLSCRWHGITLAGCIGQDWSLEMRCFICLAERPGSDEHVFPLSLGGTLVTDRVCKPCNDRLGSEVDKPLINHMMCQIKRAELQLAGNSGAIPNPLVGMLAGAYLASDPEALMDVRDDGHGKITVRHRHREVETRDETGNLVKVITIDASRSGDVVKIVDRHRKRAGMPPLDAEQKAKIVADLPAAIRTIEQPELRGNFRVDIIEYQRGLVKIAYELACLWLGDAYLDFPTAAELRALMFASAESVQESPLGNFQFGTHPRLQGWGETPLDHVAYGFVERGVAIIALRIFDVFSAAFVVAMPGDTSVPKGWRGKFVSINPASGAMHEMDWPDAIMERVRKARPARGRKA